MKKLTVWILLCALLLSMGAVAAAAAELPNVSWTPGTYAGESFTPLGNMPIEWAPDFAERMNINDGDLGDWYGGGFARTIVSPENMVSWVAEKNGIPENWGMSVFCAADPTYLYLAFDVTDNSFTYGTDAATYNGDAIQLGIDFGGLLRRKIEKDSDDLINHHYIYYSFACMEDGAPLVISRQDSDQDGCLSEANGDPVKGAARKTEKGWSVELALSLELLFDDYCWKAWDDGTHIYLGTDEHLGLEIGLTMSYLNRETPGGNILWAAAATNGTTDSAGIPQISWTPYDNGSTLILEYQEGMHFDCGDIVIVTGLETTAPETEPPYDPDVETYFSTEIATEIATEPYTELASEAQTLPPVWEESYAVEWEDTLRDAAEDLDKEAELNAILEKYGCTSTLGLGSLAVLLTLAAAAYVIRKKK